MSAEDISVEGSSAEGSGIENVSIEALDLGGLTLTPSTLVFIVLGLTLAAFIWGRFRYDLVALAALLGSVMLGLVPAESAFAGFGHPAVITVAAVLVLSRGFERSGVVDIIANQVLKVGENLLLQLLVLVGTIVVLSGIMNNVGALALLLPVAMRLAREHNTSPSLLLMPLAFGSLLGGLTTMIGTPPNIIISSYRRDVTDEAFSMFSFSPVGIVVALAGLAFIVLVGWRLTPKRSGQASTDEMFDTANYLVELKVGEESKAKGLTLQQLRDELDETIPVLAVVRDDNRRAGYNFHGALEEGDILLLEAGPDELQMLEDKVGLSAIAELEEDPEAEDAEPTESDKDPANKKDSAQDRQPVDTEGLQLIEAVVRNDSMMINRSVRQLRLNHQFGLHLVAVARDGGRLKQRLRDIRFKNGDVLLLQGSENEMSDSLASLGCLPLASRELHLGQPRKLAMSIAIFALAIVAMLFDLLPAAVAMSSAALISLLIGVLPLREGYQAIDGPVIVLLAAMIPVGEALETSGGADLIANALLSFGSDWPVVVTMIGLFLLSMLLSNVVNNAAAALLMAPIAVSLANGFDVSLDPFLMVVAVSASCAFLTPIGHQSNTLVLGPGGYRFGDYWKLGLPLSLVVLVVAIPMILWVWPL
ncbi:SLC13 family permease [Vreelandella titanicae]|uniref:Divalent ion symporter n=1 Tax=Vreelandella titanicae BH1 TaxID=1204738 RepID=L9UBD9_9GAMM|nr:MULTISPECIES: SLC13 family permease [Halomonas]NAO96847.1 SLC13 family permease [Halomonas sp. MG34]QGQ70340.1 SLC13 family permease [Halomonas sp. PA16-9]ELY22199.1 Divalent ion symporter [Halomonas titanicae BH1]MCE7517490.1 SLC13 family permease [Halomonas titanicae]PKH59814.1 SLC13 family permease [Halomonas sp. Choline-3u-9]|tara:strand:- start:3825 stop:5765 length:1941 start_codon:yes stop_codon:yes gene_type:complete